MLHKRENYFCFYECFVFELYIIFFVLQRENKRQKAKILTNKTGPETGYSL